MPRRRRRRFREPGGLGRGLGGASEGGVVGVFVVGEAEELFGGLLRRFSRFRGGAGGGFGLGVVVVAVVFGGAAAEVSAPAAHGLGVLMGL